MLSLFHLADIETGETEARYPNHLPAIGVTAVASSGRTFNQFDGRIAIWWHRMDVSLEIDVLLNNQILIAVFFTNNRLILSLVTEP